MSKLKNKFNRVGSDASQLQKFADEVCDNFSNEEGKWIDPSQGGGTKLYNHNTALSIIDDSGKTINVSVDIISLSNTSLTNYGASIQFLNGLMIQLSGGGENAYLICNHKPAGDNRLYVICIGSMTSPYNLTNGKQYSATVVSDTVTPL